MPTFKNEFFVVVVCLFVCFFFSKNTDLKFKKKKKPPREFPGGSVVKSPASDAGNVVLIPAQGTKIRMRQLSSCITAAEPVHSGACVKPHAPQTGLNEAK